MRPVDYQLSTSLTSRLTGIISQGPGRKAARQMEQSALKDIDAREWLPGKVVGEKYILVEKLGEEGVVSLYSAGTAAAEPRIVRALCAGLADDPALAEDFREVVDLVRTVSHPNLPAIEAAGEAEGRPFLVTRPIEGRTLEELMRDEERIDPARVCFIGRQIAAALETIHRLGVLHLGLNPRYMIVSGPAGEERVTVQGIGAAQVRMSRVRRCLSGASRPGRSLALEDLMPVAPAYCAPEAALARSPELLDGRADLYSLGVLIYRLLMGRLPAAPPDDAEDHALDVLAGQADPPASPLEFDATVPEQLVRLVRQLLEERRELRPSTAKVVKQWFDLVARRVRTPGLAARKPQTPATRERQSPPVWRPALQTPPLADRRPEARQPASQANSTAASPTAGAESEPFLPPPGGASTRSILEPVPGLISGPGAEPVRASLAAQEVVVASEPVAESAAGPEPELIPQALPQPIPAMPGPATPAVASEATAEPPGKPPDSFAELSLEAPPAAGPTEPPVEPIMLRPGGRVIIQTPVGPTPVPGRVMVPGPAAPSQAAFGGPNSVLFKTQSPAHPPVGWGRRALAALVVVLVAAAAVFFIGESRKLQWGSMTPTKVDQEHSLSRPDANAEVPQPVTPPESAPSTATPATTGPANAAPGATEPASTAQPQSGSSTPGSNSARVAAAAPGDTAAPLSPLQDQVKPPAQTHSKVPSEEAADIIRNAVAAGDVFYQTGQYDLAIQTYEGPLKDHPRSELLRSRIERARKAKAAEQEYLGQ